MPQVPQFNREVKLNGAAKPYMKADVNGDMFGVNIAQANANLAGGLQEAAKTAMKIQDIIEDTKTLELSNGIEQWAQENLYDKDNGYFYKYGKDAVGKSADVMKSFDEFIQDYKSKNRVTPYTQRRMDSIIQNKRSRICYNANNHDVQQTNEWAKTEGQIGMDNAINGMIHARNTPDQMAVQMANGLQTVRWQGMTQKLDGDTIAAMEKDFKSKAHEAVLNSYIQEGSLQAGEYFEKYKDEIRPDVQAKYIGAIKNEEMKYQARGTAEEIFNLFPASEENGFKELEKRKELMDIDTYDNTERRLAEKYTQRRKMEQMHDDEVFRNIYSVIDNKTANNEVVMLDDIDIDAIRNPKDRLAMRNYINDLNNHGGSETKAYVLDELTEMSMNDAQNFRKLNLDKFRPYLSASDLKTLKTRQNNIINMTPTQIMDDNAIIQEAIKTFDFKGNMGGWFGARGEIDKAFINSVKSYVREYELKHGKNLTGQQLTNVVYDFARTMKYENPDEKAKMYERYAEGMNNRAFFTRDVLSDWENAAKIKGSPLTDEEKYKIVNKRISAKLEDDNRETAEALSAPYSPKIGDIWQGHRITSLYGKRQQPKAGASSDHKGIDLAYRSNEPFKAFSSGIVENIGYDKELGNYVDIKSADGTIHRYGHVNKINVEKGARVKAGDYLGLAGSTGNSTGPHVHYAQIKNGKFVNPLDNNINTTNQMVKIKAPDGRIVNVPQSMADEAIKKGGIKL